MLNFTRFTTTLSCFSVLLVSIPVLTQEQPTATSVLPNTQPNIIFNVKTKTGQCPTTVSLWNLSRYYEGGVEHTAIADTLPIAGNPELISSSNKFVQFKAPLTKAYESCNGLATSETRTYYSFRFRDRYAYFQVNIKEIPRYSLISDQKVTASRPVVVWQVAD
ncbi:MAG TPA: hypothetical protein V6D15_00685 [Oculatellaceae cyanobacterium]|jgi:hypothetical protein